MIGWMVVLAYITIGFLSALKAIRWTVRDVGINGSEDWFDWIMVSLAAVIAFFFWPLWGLVLLVKWYGMERDGNGTGE